MQENEGGFLRLEQSMCKGWVRIQCSIDQDTGYIRFLCVTSLHMHTYVHV